MARTDGRTGSHIQEGRSPAAGRPAPPAAGEERPPAPEERQPGWQLAATVWAIVFLFLAALLVFDLFAGLFQR
jgi:hypothetical protein